MEKWQDALLTGEEEPFMSLSSLIEMGYWVTRGPPKQKSRVKNDRTSQKRRRAKRRNNKGGRGKRGSEDQSGSNKRAKLG